MHKQEMNPGNLLKISGSYWQTCTLHAAVKLDIFTIIGNRCLKSDDISDMLHGNQRSVEMLLLTGTLPGISVISSCIIIIWWIPGTGWMSLFGQANP